MGSGFAPRVANAEKVWPVGFSPGNSACLATIHSACCWALYARVFVASYIQRITFNGVDL